MTPQVGDIWEWTDLAEVKSYWLLLEPLKGNARVPHAKFFQGLCLTDGKSAHIVFQGERRWRFVA